jgi:hypothetical protein
MSQEEIKLPPYLNASYEGDDLFTGDQVRELLAKQEQSVSVGEPDWKALVLNHNADCESRCDMDRCGYKPYFEYSKRRCPDCPVHEMIDVEYTTPQQRTWVGLTDEEEQELDEKYGDDINVYIDQRDLKLKEKNT